MHIWNFADYHNGSFSCFCASFLVQPLNDKHALKSMEVQCCLSLEGILGVCHASLRVLIYAANWLDYGSDNLFFKR